VDAAGTAGALRAAGFRVTRPRLLVHEALAALGGHRTADEVADALADAGHRLPRMSVYNALDALRSAHLVMVADAGPGPVLHEVAGEWHHHFVCKVCGDVTDIPCRVGESPCIDAGFPGAEVDEAQVIFRGTCPSCRAPVRRRS
jgi:Fe2+ or Zn2+ uptake regulation protein